MRHIALFMSGGRRDFRAFCPRAGRWLVRLRG